MAMVKTRYTPDDQLATKEAIEYRLKDLAKENTLSTYNRIQKLKARLPKEAGKEVICHERVPACLLAGKLERDGKVV